MNSAYTGKLGLYNRNALGFSMGSWPKDLSFLGCHVICSDEKLEPLCSRHSCPGCSGILASSDSVQKCSHVKIFLRLASTCFVATPCSPLSCTRQSGFFFQAVLPGSPLSPPGHLNTAMLHKTSKFFPQLVPDSRALGTTALRVMSGHKATF